MQWDTEGPKNLTGRFDIHNSSLQIVTEADPRRMLVVSCPVRLKAGAGGEVISADAKIDNGFAENFTCQVSLSDTATRAANMLDCLGPCPVLQAGCYVKKNLFRKMEERLGDRMRCMCSKGLRGVEKPPLWDPAMPSSAVCFPAH